MQYQPNSFLEKTSVTEVTDVEINSEPTSMFTVDVRRIESFNSFTQFQQLHTCMSFNNSREAITVREENKRIINSIKTLQNSNTISRGILKTFEFFETVPQKPNVTCESIEKQMLGLRQEIYQSVLELRELLQDLM